MDTGAGVGKYTDQLRSIFENNDFGIKFEVLSTGLSKKAAKTYRNRQSMPGLHQNELKWRSISEMSDFPEFDLIIDSYGEQLYSSQLGPRRQPDNEVFGRYIEIVLSKLKGYASIAPVPFSGNNMPDWFEDLSKNFNVSFWVKEGALKDRALKIQKLNV